MCALHKQDASKHRGERPATEAALIPISNMRKHPAVLLHSVLVATQQLQSWKSLPLPIGLFLNVWLCEQFHKQLSTYSRTVAEGTLEFI